MLSKGSILGVPDRVIDCESSTKNLESTVVLVYLPALLTRVSGHPPVSKRGARDGDRTGDRLRLRSLQTVSGTERKVFTNVAIHLLRGTPTMYTGKTGPGRYQVRLTRQSHRRVHSATPRTQTSPPRTPPLNYVVTCSCLDPGYGTFCT